MKNGLGSKELKKIYYNITRSQLLFQTGCWSPDGSVLLFCTVEEPIIYSLLFSIDEHKAVIGGSKSATASADLSAVDFETDEGPIRYIFIYKECASYHCKKMADSLKTDKFNDNIHTVDTNPFTARRKHFLQGFFLEILKHFL